MSYCRWSSDDWQCDVYVYADVAGSWKIHVAENRVVYGEPLPPRVGIDDSDAWIKRRNDVMEIYKRSPKPPIGLPHDGESFSLATPGECADKLEELKALGYNVPDYAIEELREDTAEEEP